MHIFFQNNQYLGSYYFTRSADDPVDINMVPEDEVSLRVMRDDLGRGVANEGGGKQQRDDLGGKNLAAAVTLELGHSTQGL